MKTVKIVLGNREYQVQSKPIGPSKAWRKRFAEPVQALVGSLRFTGDLLNQPISNGADLGGMVSQLGSVLLSGVGETLLGSMDLALEMVCSYAPEIEADRERIEAEAYDDEVLRALWEVLKLAYPFGILGDLGGLTGMTKQSSS